MGRHRPDPRGHARILIATLAVVLALALLIVGGLALFRVFTSESDRSAPKASPQNGSAVSVTSSAPAARTQQAVTRHALAFKVTGAPTRVYVSAGGNSQVFLDQVLNTGEVRYFDQAPLDVVVADGSAVDIYVYGKRQRKGEPGQRAQYHVPER